MSHQIVILAIPPGHFNFMLVREHAHLLKSLMRAPDNQRYFVPDSRLYREHRLACENRPIDTAKPVQGAACDFLYRYGIDILIKDRSEERRVGKEGRSRWSPD